VFPLAKFSAITLALTPKITPAISCLPSLPWPPWVEQHRQDPFYCPRQVRKAVLRCDIKGVIAYKLCQCTRALMDHLHWQHLLVIMPAPATSVFTCLGHLGQCDTDRIASTYVMPPKVPKASTSVLLLSVIVAGIIAPPLLM